MNYDWVNDYIGIPFKTNGRDRDGMDCYGLITAVFKDQQGVDLPDWHVADDTTYTVMKTIDKGLHIELDAKRAHEVDEPEDMDILVLSRMGVAYHVGIYIAGGVLHTVYNGSGSCFEQYNNFEKNSYGEIRWFRWQI